MRKTKFKALAVICFLFITAFSFAFQGEPDGFRGLKWGDKYDPAKFITIERSHSDTDLAIGPRICLLAGDKMQIGIVDTEAPWYIFDEEKDLLVGVSVRLKSGYNNYEFLLQALKIKYGQPSAVTDTKQIVWEGEISEVSIGYVEEINAAFFTLFQKAYMEKSRKKSIDEVLNDL